MKKYFNLLVSIIILVSYSSCSYSESIEENVRKEVRISASFENLSDDSKVTTRAVDNAWESGDAIGVFMKKAGVTLEHLRYQRMLNIQQQAHHLLHLLEKLTSFITPSINRM